MTRSHIGLSFGRVEHWHDGLGEFSRQLAFALAAQAPRLAAERDWHLHFHLPQRWHGLFGDAVGYLGTHTTQRFVHLSRTRFALWHVLHQHNRLRAPLGTWRRVETVHDLNFLHAKSAAKIERYRRRLQARLRARDAVIAITQHVADDIARELPGLATPLQVIHNGATDLTSTPLQAVREVGDTPFLLHVSRMAPSKNIRALLDLAAAWPEQRLVLAGATSPYAVEVQRDIAQRGLANVVVRLDISEAEKAWLYAHCRAFVFPSLAEGFGLPPIEAMHFGKPVFLSRRTSLPEVGGDAARYFDAFDGASMRATIAAGLPSLESPAGRAASIARARSFSWTLCAEAHVALYARVLAS
jgi:glycosyltransferase involved in cell wall biosynthesis